VGSVEGRVAIQYVILSDDWFVAVDHFSDTSKKKTARMGISRFRLYLHLRVVQEQLFIQVPSKRPDTERQGSVPRVRRQ
jgi:hypothetical protein